MKRFKRNQNYRKIYCESNNLTLDDIRGLDIHHIDGNRDNNDPSNLLAVTREEHIRIHEEQGDAGAVRLLKDNPGGIKSPWNKGITYTEEQKKNMYGRVTPLETRKKQSEAHKGKKLSEEHKRKTSETMKGRPALHLKGKPWSEARRQAQENRKKKL